MAGLYGSSTDEQRRSSGKDRQPGGLFSGGHLSALLLSHRALAMLLRRALPAARQKTARPFLILIQALPGFLRRVDAHDASEQIDHAHVLPAAGLHDGGNAALRRIMLK